MNGGRIAAVEILVVTEAIKSCIREGKTQQIASQIQTGGVHGMQTQATALADLVRRGVVSEDVAIGVAHQLEDLRHQIASGGSSLRSVRSGAPAGLRRLGTASGPVVDPLPAAEPSSNATGAPATPPPGLGYAAPTNTASPADQKVLLERLRRA